MSISSHPDYHLHPTRIDIWKIYLDTQAAPQLSYLDDAEQERYHRFHFLKHKTRFLQTRIAVKTLLSRYLHLPVQSLQFQEDINKKPFIQNVRALTFNLSHSGEQALLAVGQTYPLGVDIERFSLRPYLGIANHSFSQTEQQALESLPQSLQPLAFFNIWAQKEAFIKAIGLGLRYPTQSFDVPAFPHHSTISGSSEQAAGRRHNEYYDPIYQQTWRLHPFMPLPAFSAALCYHPSITTIRYFDYETA